MPYLCGLWRFANAYYLEYKRGDEHMQNTQFRELEEQEIFVIQGGEYDRINSCFNREINNEFKK